MAETAKIDAAGFTGNGTERERVTLPSELFDGTINMPVMHQAVKAFLANKRQGNAATKNRRYVVGGNQKPWKQKGTGRARQGSIRAPHWVGGGTVFGPQPRSYAQYVPRQVRALARKSALNTRASEGAVIVVDRLSYEAPKTSRLAALINRLDLDDSKVLILTDGLNENVYLSGRNLPSVHVLPYADVSAYHLLWSDTVIIEAGALGQVLEAVADREPDEAPKKRKAPARPEKAKKVRKVEPRAAAASTKKGTARKSSAGRAAVKKTPSKKAGGGGAKSAKPSKPGKTSARKKSK